MERVSEQEPSPIALLPPEILSSIFMLVDIQHHLDLFSQTQIRSHGLSGSTGSHLGQVCCQWRNVSLSTPALWSSILLEIGNHPHSYMIFNRVQECLDRSASHPLSITLVATRLSHEECSRIIAETPSVTLLSEGSDSPKVNNLITALDLCRVILRHTPRIHNLSLKFDDCDLVGFARNFVSKVQARFQYLRHLAIYAMDVVPVLESFTPTPLLQSIAITDLCGRFRTLSRPQNLSRFQITRLHISQANTQSLFFVLSHLPHLQSATLTMFPAGPYPDFGVRVILPHLTDLDLGVSHILHIVKFKALLQALDTPSLKNVQFRFNLSYHSYPSDIKPFPEAIASFITRYPHIESLHLVDIPFEDNDLLSMLSGLSKLRVLDITDVDGYGRALTDTFLREFSEIVPRLKDLRLVLRLSQYGKGLLEQMIERRLGYSCVRLVRLVAERSAALGLDIQRLRDMERHGVAIMVAIRQAE